MRRATAFAPASIGNVGVGFDVLGHAFEGPGDTVTVTQTRAPEVVIAAIRGAPFELPRVASENTAGRAVLALQARSGVTFGFEVEIDKGIALGSGMGGSAASAVAAVVAANALLETPLSLEALYACAVDGEAVASGSAHGDNVGPMLLGGLVIAPHRGTPVKVPTPPWLHVAVVHPHFVLETKRARAVLSPEVPLRSVVTQTEHLALVLAGCFTNDASLIARGLEDVLIEPKRASLIPGFDAVKGAALQTGALGASIAGAGPSVFAWFRDRPSAERGAAAMATAFTANGLQSDCFVSRVDGPAARVLTLEALRS